MSHPDDERYDIIRQPPFRRVNHDHNKPSSTRSDTVMIDVSKLKAGDQYYNEREGWVEVGRVDIFDTGIWSIYDTVNPNEPLRCFRDGEQRLGQSGWTITQVKIKEQPSEQETSTKITSDGGSSGYYLFPQSLVDLVIKTGKLETKDIIKHGFGNDNDFGNVFKALKRLYELKIGGGKDGSTAEYEVNKMKYFLNEILEDLK
jgi:hypothetical protein